MSVPAGALRVCVWQVSGAVQSCGASAQMPGKPQRAAACVPQTRTVQPRVETDPQGSKKHLRGSRQVFQIQVYMQ